MKPTKLAIVGEKDGATFEDWLKVEAEKTYSPTPKKDLNEMNVAWLRKSINTDISKIKRGEGKKSTLLLAINRKMKQLAELSIKDFQEMKIKVDSI